MVRRCLSCAPCRATGCLACFLAISTGNADGWYDPIRNASSTNESLEENVCVFVIVENVEAIWKAERWVEAAAETWATELTFFVTRVGYRPRGYSKVLAEIASISGFIPSQTNRSRPRSGQNLRLGHRIASGYGVSWRQALEFWGFLSRLLARNVPKPNMSAPLAILQRCQWLMHADTRSYINVPRLASRLRCLGKMWPGYYALAPMTNEARVSFADEVGGYIFARAFLEEVDMGAVLEVCLGRLLQSGDAVGFGWSNRPGFYVSLCLWMELRVMPLRLGDPSSEVIVPTADKPTDPTGPAAVRSLSPCAHCIISVVCSHPQSFLEVHRLVKHPINSLQVGCVVYTWADRDALSPPWSHRVVTIVSRCPIARALRLKSGRPNRSPTALTGLSRLLAELAKPSQPRGTAAELLRRQWPIRRELCIILPATDATLRQVQRGQATARTWAKPYIGALLRQESPVIALFYSAEPFLGFEAATLSLLGDLDLRHPKFNALRFVYLWKVVAKFFLNDCDFFMKADMDAYVNVPGLRHALKRFDASSPLYLGTVTQSYGPTSLKDPRHSSFAHGLGYVLSRGALLAAGTQLDVCMNHLVGYRLESIEDMLIASCLKAADVFPRDIGPTIFDFQGIHDVDRVLAEVEVPLIVHPVEPDAMEALHRGFCNRATLNLSTVLGV